MPWSVWEDFNDEDRPVYAMFNLTDDGEEFGRVYKLGPAGRVVEISSAVLPHGCKPLDLITELGAVSKPAGLVNRPGAAIQIDGVVFAYARGTLWSHHPVTGDFVEVVGDWPADLVLLADCSLGRLHPSRL